MTKNSAIFIFFSLCSFFFLGHALCEEALTALTVTDDDRALRRELIKSLEGRICEYTLPNGMSILCIPAINTNVVSVGAFVRVGSADEQPGEWGLAHILEHMVFKETKTRREGDIERLATAFACKYNAHTTHDHTYYYFTSDNKNWRVFADVIADATQNLQVTPGALNSELAAICQEIKIGGHDLDDLSLGKLLPMNHPYAHGIIGYKEQVLAYSADDVMAFYQQHYVPEKTTFFVCGNVTPFEVFDYVKDAFSGFERAAKKPASLARPAPFFAGFSSTQKVIYHTQDYRVSVSSWCVPGAGSSESLVFPYIATALTLRLKNKLVDELGLCFDIRAAFTALPSVGLFSVSYVPRPGSYQVDFDALIKDEIAALAKEGLTDAEFSTMFHAQTAQLVACAEDPATLTVAFASMPQTSSAVVEEFFARQEALLQVGQETIKEVASAYLRPFSMNKLTLLPLPPEEHQAWNALQVKVSLHESALLQARKRTDAPLAQENGGAVLPARIDLDPVSVGAYETFTLSNGVQVYWQQNETSPRRVCALVLKDIEKFSLAYQASGKAFAWEIAPRLLLQGTEKYSAAQVLEEFFARGISLTATSAVIRVSALKSHFDEGMQLMRHLLEEAIVPESMLARYKEEAAQGINLSKNSPGHCLGEYLTKTLYAAYPWRFTSEQVISNLQTVKREDILQLFALFRDPSRVGLVMCGDFDKNEARRIAERYFAPWQQNAEVAVPSIEIPAFSSETVNGHIELPLEQSQIIFLRGSCLRGDEDATALVLLRSYLAKELFAVRERSGLFYAAGADISFGTKNLPGLVYLAIHTTPANILAARNEIQRIIQELFANGISSTAFLELKEARAHARGTYFNTADTVASVFVRSLAEGFSLDFDEHFDKQVDAVTLDQLNLAIAKYFDPAAWSCITVGRSVV